MAIKPSVLLAASLIALLPASGVLAADSETTAMQRCEQQQTRIQALEKDRAQMTHDIERLLDQNRELKQTLERIRSQLGNQQPGPTSRGSSGYR